MEEKTERQLKKEAARLLGSLGGNATKKKYGNDYFKALSQMRRTHGNQKNYKECNEEEKYERDHKFTLE